MARITTTEATERIEAAVRKAAESDAFLEVLKLRRKLHNYSLNNLMLIWSQNPEATQVAGFKRWQELGRQVRKGEKSLKILAPMVGKREDANGIEKSVVFGFRTVSVFDIGQTDGPDIELPWRTFGDAPEGAFSLLVSVAEKAGLRVEVRPTGSGAIGFLRRSESLIVVDPGCSPAEAVKVLAHELGHAFDPWLIENPTEYRAHRGDCEAVAESVAFLVADGLGIDAETAAGTYIASWLDGDASKMRPLAKRIDEAAKPLLEAIEKATEAVAAPA